MVVRSVGVVFHALASWSNIYPHQLFLTWAELSNVSVSKIVIATARLDGDRTNDDHSTSNDSSAPTTCTRPMGGKEWESIVTVESAGKRLRWFLKSNTTLSKSQADAAIRSGRVWVDGARALDTSRILKVGMSVALYSAVSEAANGAVLGSNDHGSIATIAGDSVKVVSRHDPFLIVKKPSGMRTKGAIPGSLEFVVSRQEGVLYECVSRLDTSTSGLCALIPKTTYLCLQNPPGITHSMVALLHGRVPDDWFPVFQHEYTSATIPLRKWKKRKHTKDESDSGPLSSSSATTSESSIGGVTIFPLERSDTASSGISLSTVCIETKFPSAASICHTMRMLGYPVVGDTHCRREYLELKRSIRNRIKNKICLVSHQVTFTTDDKTGNNFTVPPVQPPIADKLSAVYWDTHFGAGEGGAQTIE